MHFHENAPKMHKTSFLRWGLLQLVSVFSTKGPTNELRSRGPTQLMDISSMQYTKTVKFLKSVALLCHDILDAM